MRTVAGSVPSPDYKVRRANAVTAGLLGIADLKAIAVSGDLRVIEDLKASPVLEGQRAPRVNQESKVNGD